MEGGKTNICKEGWKLKQNVYVTALIQNSFFSGKPQFSLLRPSTLLLSRAISLKSTDYKC